MYFNRQEGPRIWLDFRYEGIFVYCTKCGRVGHKRPRCKLPIAIAQRHFEMVIKDVGQGIFLPIVAQNFLPLFTNQLIGLKRVERNRTSQVNLVQYSWERDNEGDNLSKQTLLENDNDEDNSDSSSSSESDGPSNQENRDHEDSHLEGNNKQEQGEATNETRPHNAGFSKRKRNCSHANQTHNKKRKSSYTHAHVQDNSQAGNQRRMKNKHTRAHINGKTKISKMAHKIVKVVVAMKNGKCRAQEPASAILAPAKHSILPHLARGNLLQARKVINEDERRITREKKRRREFNADGRPNHQTGEASHSSAGKLISLASFLALIGFYDTTPLTQQKGSNVNLYSKFSKTTHELFRQRVLMVFFLTILA